MKDQFLRFGIRNNGLRAATWKIWTPKLKSDIYLSCRELKGSIKASLHQSGSWHFGYTDQALDKYFESEEAFEKSKYIEIWPRPKPIADGVTLAFRIVTPHSATTTPVGQTSKDVFWIPNCSEGSATEIDIIISPATNDAQNWPGKNRMGTKLIGSYNLPSKETVWVVYWEIALPDLSSFSGKAFNFFKGKSKIDLVGANLKAILFGDEQDGSRTLFDCSVEKTRS
jgi:hypothetical protein